MFHASLIIQAPRLHSDYLNMLVLFPLEQVMVVVVVVAVVVLLCCVGRW